MSIAVSIKNTRFTGPDQHIEYEIHVAEMPMCWRRYREFDDLNRKFKQEGFLVPQPLPPKRLFGGNSTAVVQERVRGLSTWLSSVVSSIDRTSSAANLLKQFLLSDPWELGTTKSSQQPSIGNTTTTISHRDSLLRDIVSRFTQAASAAPPITSLSKIQAVKLLKDQQSEPTGEEVDLTAFKEMIANAENIFQCLKPGKTL